jgi:hypothetical protein
MKNQSLALGSLVKEYCEIVANSTSSETSNSEIDWVKVENELQLKAEWTQNGVHHLSSLVRNYGSFVLRNALALAIATGIEDGELKL